MEASAGYPMNNILTPMGDGAKFVVTRRSGENGYSLVFVDGHGYSRTIAHSTVTDPDATELEWLANSAASFHNIGLERDVHHA